MTQIEKIRNIIKRFSENPKNAKENYRLFLAKCTQLFEYDTKLIELEQLEQPGDAESSEIFKQQLKSISDEVRKIIWS